MEQAILTSLYSLGDVYLQMDNIKKAYFYYEKALKLAQENNQQFEIAYCQLSLGRLEWQLHHITKALEYLKNAYIVFKKQNAIIHLITTLNTLIRIYQKTNHLNKQLEKIEELYIIVKKVNLPEQFFVALIHFLNYALAIQDKILMQKYLIELETLSNTEENSEIIAIIKYFHIAIYFWSPESDTKTEQLSEELKELISQLPLEEQTDAEILLSRFYIHLKHYELAEEKLKSLIKLCQEEYLWETLRAYYYLIYIYNILTKDKLIKKYSKLAKELTQRMLDDMKETDLQEYFRKHPIIEEILSNY